MTTRPSIPATGGYPPAETPHGAWHYWVAFAATGKSGACELSRPQRITHREHIEDLQATIARHLGLSNVVVLSFTPLRVQDASGRVVVPGEDGADLLEQVLDDLDRLRDHDELIAGTLTAVADAVQEELTDPHASRQKAADVLLEAVRRCAANLTGDPCGDLTGDPCGDHDEQDR